VNIPESHLAQEAIAALVDGELAGGPAARAARHLTGCAQCRMAVQAQREAKEALHASSDVAVPGDLLSRLRAIPFTADVPGAEGELGSLRGRSRSAHRQRCHGRLVGTAGPPPVEDDRPGHARWLRRGFIGTLGVLGSGVTTLALNLPPDSTAASARHRRPTSASRERTEIVPPGGARDDRRHHGVQPPGIPGGTP
jgi:anti-sigma factor RsiW